MITLSLFFLLAGCGGPEAEADDAMQTTSEAVAEHNRLYEEARESYDGAREALDAGENPEDQVESITQARETLLEARGSLEDARASLSEVEGMEVEQEIKDYANSLSEAMGAQLEAEAREAEFYEILEQDPILEDDRDRAERVLSQAGDGYERADEAYARAQEIAEANPDLLQQS